MSYSSTNPPQCILALGFASGGSLFKYESTHTHADIESTAGGGFFKGCGFGSPSTGSGSFPAGMKVGDLLININRSTAGTSAITWHQVTSISTPTGYGSLLNVAVSVASS
ncbi:hypothetical protein [Pseudogulbenkiania sp. MAI-1]|uniref:hypothetical protein n=1 Tax=Pseudogulbenkiania sp. MAI-1 TaxID=990370 RepID=UPI000A00CB73|nr:hypothetical protein [Pseudogulbenkiania sp. MAI-1]